MNENTSKRREWVKTAAIIFLAVMLVLTFFSNTIMNYSLPVVSAQYINSGSITAKVRGTGVIEAADPYNVELTETRVIKSVAVREGDLVEKDQILFYLEDVESEELKAAEAALESALLEFEKTILAGDVSASVISNVQSGVDTPTATYQNRITAAQNNYDAWQAQVDELEKQKSLISSNGIVDTSAEETTLSNAKAKLSAAQANYNSIKDMIGTLDEGTARANAENLLTVANSYALPMQNAEAIMKADSAKLNALNTVLAAKKAYDAAVQAATDAGADPATDEACVAKLDALSTAITTANGLACGEHNTCTISQAADAITADEINGYLNTVNTHYQTNATNYTTAKGDYDTAYANYVAANEQYLLFGQKKNAESAVHTAQSEVNKAQEALNKKTSSGNEIDKKLNEAISARDKAKTDLDKVIADIQAELNLGSQNDKIAELREEVEKLRAKSIGAEVKAPVAGKIGELYCVAGETINAGSTMAVIQPAGKGFSLKFSVTADQAKRLSPGDPAEVQNSWYYNEISATLTQITNDPDNPGRNKLLVFNVEGDVMGGQSLSLSVGQKSANYDMIVPNSAIREDNNGKFVLIVESKSSPLGNRYIATRVDVEVLASDDTQSAISGALYGYEFVITTSNKPVEAGKQVRLSDN